MIHSALFRKHFAIAAVSVLGLVYLGSLASTFFIQRIYYVPAFQPPMFFVHAIEDLGKGDAVAGVKKAEEYESQGMPFKFSVLDEKGKTLYGREHEFSLAVSSFPKEVHQALQFGLRQGSRGERPNEYLVKLANEPARYLVIASRNQPNGLIRTPRLLFPMTFVTLSLSVLVGIALALFLIFRSLSDHVKTADHVISELQKGNLKARFPLMKNDEIGKAMTRFNQMADEIEKLVDRVQAAEKSRNFLLQELTHDLRTPVASLRSLLETVFSEAKLAPPIDELSGLAIKETEYIARLVEDLLLLAQVSEPKYRPEQKPLDLNALLQQEAESMEMRKTKSVKLIMNLPTKEASLLADEQLMRRLIRNGLENAFSYATSQVEVRVDLTTGGKIKLQILDDGPGFDAESLAKFGERRTQRTIAKIGTGRLSLGLGSVIMKTISILHDGEIHAFNRENGMPGACIELTLPRA